MGNATKDPDPFPVPWREALPQLVQAQLLVDAGSPGAPWRKAVVLASFVQRHRPASGSANMARHNLPIPGCTWDDERFDAIAEAASKWLEHQFQ